MAEFLLHAGAAFTGSALAILSAWVLVAHFGVTLPIWTTPAAHLPASRTAKAVALSAAALFAAVFCAVAYWISNGELAPAIGLIAIAVTLLTVKFVINQFRTV